MIALDTFEQELRALTGDPTDLRPLVCEGSPLDCRAFIVGFNPATEMSSDFWSFWRSGYGFDKRAWLTEYLAERQSRPLKPGKIRRSALSNTRSRIEWVLQGADPIRCLETNIYSAATTEAAELDEKRRITAPFDFLMSAIKPKVIVVHGKDAEAHVVAKHTCAHVIAVPHFARGWSQSSARALGQQIRQACDA